MIAFLQKKQARYKKHRSIPRTQTSQEKRYLVTERINTQNTVSFFPNKPPYQNQTDRPLRLKTQRRGKSSGFLHKYESRAQSPVFSKELKKRRPLFNHHNFLSEAIQKVERSMQNDKIKQFLNVKASKGLTPFQFSLTISRNSPKFRVTIETEEQILAKRKLIVKQTLQTDKQMILKNNTKSKKAMALRQVLIGKSGGFQSEQIIQNLKKQYDAKIADLAKRQAERREQEKNYYEKKEAQKEAKRKQQEQKKQRQKYAQLQTIIKTIKAQEQIKIDYIKKQIQKSKIEDTQKIEQLKSELELVKKKQRQQKIKLENAERQLQKKTQNLQKLTKTVVSRKQQSNTPANTINSSLPSAISATSKYKKPMNRQSSYDDISDAQMIQVNKFTNPKSQSKKQKQQIHTVIQKKGQVKKIQTLPKEPSLLQEINLLSQLKTQSIKRQRPTQKNEIPKNTVQKNQKKDLIQPRLDPEKKPTPPPLTPEKKAFLPPKKPPSPPKKHLQGVPSTIRKVDTEAQEEDSVDIDQMKNKLNMVGQTIGRGSKQLKGIPINWMVPCFFIYRRFYQLRNALLLQFKDFLKDNIVTPDQIQEIQKQNESIRTSLQKMSIACEKRCNNNDIKIKLKEKFESDVKKPLYQLLQIYVQDVQKVQKSLNTDQKNKVKHHLLQTLNSILIIQQFEGKKVKPMDSETLFSEMTFANVDKLIKVYYQKIIANNREK